MFKKSNGNIVSSKQRWSLRKSTIGLASVLLGLTFLGVSQSTKVVYADAIDFNSQQEKVVQVQKNQASETETSKTTSDTAKIAEVKSNTVQSDTAAETNEVKSDTAQTDASNREISANNTRQLDPNNELTEKKVTEDKKTAQPETDNDKILKNTQTVDVKQQHVVNSNANLKNKNALLASSLREINPQDGQTQSDKDKANLVHKVTQQEIDEQIQKKYSQVINEAKKDNNWQEGLPDDETLSKFETNANTTIHVGNVEDDDEIGVHPLENNIIKSKDHEYTYSANRGSSSILGFINNLNRQQGLVDSDSYSNQELSWKKVDNNIVIKATSNYSAHYTDGGYITKIVKNSDGSTSIEKIYEDGTYDSTTYDNIDVTEYLVITKEGNLVHKFEVRSTSSEDYDPVQDVTAFYSLIDTSLNGKDGIGIYSTGNNGIYLSDGRMVYAIRGLDGSVVTATDFDSVSDTGSKIEDITDINDKKGQNLLPNTKDTAVRITKYAPESDEDVPIDLWYIEVAYGLKPGTDITGTDIIDEINSQFNKEVDDWIKKVDDVRNNTDKTVDQGAGYVKVGIDTTNDILTPVETVEKDVDQFKQTVHLDGGLINSIKEKISNIPILKKFPILQKADTLFGLIKSGQKLIKDVNDKLSDVNKSLSKFKKTLDTSMISAKNNLLTIKKIGNIMIAAAKGKMSKKNAKTLLSEILKSKQKANLVINSLYGKLTSKDVNTLFGNRIKKYRDKIGKEITKAKKLALKETDNIIGKFKDVIAKGTDKTLDALINLVGPQIPGIDTSKLSDIWDKYKVTSTISDEISDLIWEGKFKGTIKLDKIYDTLKEKGVSFTFKNKTLELPKKFNPFNLKATLDKDKLSFNGKVPKFNGIKNTVLTPFENAVKKTSSLLSKGTDQIFNGFESTVAKFANNIIDKFRK